MAWELDLSKVVTAEQEAAAARKARYPDLPPDRFWAAARFFGYETALLAWVASLKPTDEQSPTYADDLAYWSVISSKVERGEIERDHPAIEDARVALGVASAELDGMWDWAWQ